MSMHQYMPDQAVLADSWTLFCPECSQKMRIIMATPALDGKAQLLERRILQRN